MSDTSSGISRRTLAKGAAWAAPAVAVAAAAPAYAKSGRPPSMQILSACKQPGGSCEKDGFPKFGYTFTVRVTNPTAEAVYLYTNASITPGPLLFATDTNGVNFSYGTAKLFTPPSSIGGNVGNNVLLTPGTSQHFLISSTDGTNSANLGVSGTLFMPWGHEQVAGADTMHSYLPTPTSASSTPPLGYIAAPFSFSAMNPCDNKTCLPTVSTTTTTLALRQAQQAQTESPTVDTSTTTVDTSTTTVDTSTTTVEP